MVQQAHQPSDLHIEARKVNYNYSAALERRRYWHNDDPLMSHLINALQATFPEGERFFIDAAVDAEKIVSQRGELSDKLSDDLQAFIRQEAAHGLQHRHWTEALMKAGYPKMDDFDDQERRLRLWFREHVPVILRLSITAAAEHYTASLARFIAFDKPELITESDSPFAELLLYHAMEEVEHKSVCFDLYMALSGSYFWRMIGFLGATIDIAYHVAVRQRYLMKTDGLWDKARRRQTNKLLYAKGGMLRAMWPNVRRYQKPSFHPWQTDEREQIERTFGRFRAEAGIPPFS